MLETYSNILAVFATVFGTIMALAYFSQAYKMYKRKSSADISLLTYFLWLLGVVSWLLYGISLNNFAIIVTNFIATVGNVCVLILYFRYNR